MKTGIMLTCLVVCRSKTAFAQRLVSRTLRIPSGAKQKKKSQRQLCQSRPSVRHSPKNLQIHRLETISHRWSVISPKASHGKTENLSRCGDMWPVEPLLARRTGSHPNSWGSPHSGFLHSNKFPGLKPGQMWVRKERNPTNRGEKEKLRVRAGGRKPTETFVFTFFSWNRF